MVNVDKDLIRDIHEYFKQINGREILKPLINEFTGETVGHKLDKIDVDGYILELNHLLKKEEDKTEEKKIEYNNCSMRIRDEDIYLDYPTGEDTMRTISLKKTDLIILIQLIIQNLK